MMKTKIILNILLVCVLTLLIVSCQKDWLEPKPLSFYAPENIYIDKAGMEAVLLSSRKNLRTEYVNQLLPIWHEYLSSDLGVACDDDARNLANFDIQLIPTSTGRYNLFQTWDIAYESIRNANIVITRLESIEWQSEKDKNEILGEALFHRAYWYYRLVHQYGDVPFISKEHFEPKLDFYSHSRNTILNKIQNDLEFSQLWVPEVVEPGKVNNAAVKHLLTKVYLANSNFDRAIETASSIINDGKYSLMTERFGSVAGDDRFNVIWDLHQRENKSISTNTEGILVVQDKYGYPGASSNGSQAIRFFSPWWSRNIFIKDPDGKRGCVDTPGNPQVISLGRGVGSFRPSNYFLYKLWEDCEADLRHDSDTNWMPKNKVLYNNPESNYYGQPVDLKYTNPGDTLKALWPWPYYKVYVKDENTPLQPRGGNSDWYVFRLAETYLLRAEAYFWKGNLINAAADINKVRERSYAPVITSTEVTIGYILDERARELYLEEPRKTELTRIAYIMAENNINGYSVENFNEKNFWFDRVTDKNFYNSGLQYKVHTFKISPYHVLWPIPQDAIDSNTKGIINQNVGYFGSEKNIEPKLEITDEQ